LQLGLDDLALGFRGGGNKLPALALQPRFLALQRGEQGELDQFLRSHIAHVDELLLA